MPTDGLYAEIARGPGPIAEIGRVHRVLLLGATRAEMLKMDDVLKRLGKQAGAFTSTIERARVRTRTARRGLRGVEVVEVVEVEEADRLLGTSETVHEELTSPSPLVWGGRGER